MKCVVIIPSLEPERKLIKYIKDILKKNFCEVIVINDGSSENKKVIFDEISKIKKCKIIHHSTNKGKGAALKTAFNYLLDHKKNVQIAITADADGQHLVSDVYKLYKASYTYQEEYILGVREFGDNTPFKSKYGNMFSSFLIKALYNINLKDTQTGLRLFHKNQFKWLTGIKGDRFEYELNVLIESKKNGQNFITIPIKTVYINNNRASHFHPIKDAYKVTSQLFKGLSLYTGSSLISAGLDILLFTLLTFLFNSIFISFATITIASGISRIISSLLNYNINSKIFNNSKNKTKNSFVKYYILWSLQLIISILLVSYFSTVTAGSKIISKIIIDLLLYIISYQIQLRWVFKK